MAQIAPGPPPEARRPTTTPATTPLGTALVAAAEGSVAALEAFAAAEGALDERRLEAIAARRSTLALRPRVDYSRWVRWPPISRSRARPGTGSSMNPSA